MKLQKPKLGEERECPSGREMWTGRQWVPSKTTAVIAGLSRLEPDCNDHHMSLAISTKRQADALERIAKALEAQNDIARNIAAQAMGGE